MSEDAPIFVGGLMKSGTSLLRKLLARHSRIFGGLETHWFAADFIDSWRDPSARRQRWLSEFFDVSAEESATLRAGATSALDFFDRFMWHCTERAGKARWVEKTPDNILQIARIGEHWPEARVIHVVRDYRDVWASWKRNQKGSLDDFLEKARGILDVVGDRAGRVTDRYREVRYEDLVSDPGPTLRPVVEWLGERWEEGLEHYEGDDDDYQRVLAVTGKASPTTESLRKPIFTSSVGQWREGLDATEVARIERELALPMQRWGWA